MTTRLIRISHDAQHVAFAAALAVLGALLVSALVGDSSLVGDLLKKAAGYSSSSVGGGDFSQLLTAGETLMPLGLVLTIAAFPIACIVGGVCLAIGSKRGMQIVGLAFGACLFTSVIGGLSA